jgi:hypothetical protein
MDTVLQWSSTIEISEEKQAEVVDPDAQLMLRFRDGDIKAYDSNVDTTSPYTCDGPDTDGASFRQPENEIQTAARAAAVDQRAKGNIGESRNARKPDTASKPRQDTIFRASQSGK